MSGWTFDFAALTADVWPRWGVPRGARTRVGTLCRGLPVLDPKSGKPRNGRCRMRGGESTGPTTAVGRAQIAASNRRRCKKP